MMTRVWAAAFAAAALLAASSARAQDRPIVSLTPPDAARGDVAGHVGWLGGNKSGIGAQWDEWYEAASFGASAGYYWTPHVKIELDAATTTEGHVFSHEPVDVPGQPFQSFRERRHMFRSTTVGAGIAYQFFENTWFHPFVGAGLEVARESARVDLSPLFPFPSGRDGAPIDVPDASVEPGTSYSARPYAAAGFKWYVSDRAFIRSDIRATASSTQVESVVWRGGVGVDF
jgi:opacity protein-like surface antigen